MRIKFITEEGLLAAKANYAVIYKEILKKKATDQPKPHKDVFWQGYGVTPQSGLRRFLFFQAVSLYSCGFALILAIRLLISSSVGMSISPIAVK